MRSAYLVATLVALTAPAQAQSGFFMGGAADGIAAAERRDLQRRALELDARDGGRRYQHLREAEQLDAINRQLRENAEVLEQLNRIERERRILRGY